MPQVPDGYVDMAEAIRIAGRNRNHIAAAAKAGQIPGAVRHGTHRTAPYYFTRDGLRAWVDSQFVPAGRAS